MDLEETASSLVSVAFRGKKHVFLLSSALTVNEIKETLIESEPEMLKLTSSDIKILYKGKDLSTYQGINILELLKPAGKQIYKLIAMGCSSSEVNTMQESHSVASKRSLLIRDDLTQKGQRDMERRKQLGRRMLHQAATRESRLVSKTPSAFASSFGFGRIEVLPNLKEQARAHDILNKLANDPGILACMKQHSWHVGALKEMYPSGKVGESAICVMGLNRNKGQEILLRLRTDDLQGFRKILSIRKVLFHELAHNVHSEHDEKFFVLMRQIERECNDLDWTGGQGLEGYGDPGSSMYSGGTHRLGGQDDSSFTNNSSEVKSSPRIARELRAQAAMNRMARGEKERKQSCGCGQENLFLPTSAEKSKNHDASDGDKNAEMDCS